MKPRNALLITTALAAGSTLALATDFKPLPPRNASLVATIPHATKITPEMYDNARKGTLPEEAPFELDTSKFRDDTKARMTRIRPAHSSILGRS